VSLSTHVLDAITGAPAVGVEVRLDTRVGSAWQPTGTGSTDPDGRIRSLGEPQVGVHRLAFDTARYFAGRGTRSFYPEVTVAVEVIDAADHHHVALLLSPYAYTTYRGS
jgi:5-hydroxyisourate hydrolase